MPRTARHVSIRRSAAIFAIAVAAACVLPAAAGAVVATCGNGSGIAGQVVEITVSTDNLTGLGVRSFQFQISYNASVVTAVGVSETGTSPGTAGWNHATIGVDPGVVTVADAGSTVLSGSGPLIKVQFQINPAQLTATSSGLTMPAATFVFDEGTPSVTTVNGTLTIDATPVVAVSPNSGEIVRGGTLAFSLSGSVSAPVSWFTTNAAVATINSSGVMTGVAPGSVRVFAVDNAAHRDTTDSDLLVRGMGLTAGSTSVLQGQSVDVPITVTSLNGLGVRAGQFTITYNPTIFTPTSFQTPAGTLLHNWGPVGFGHGSGSCTVDFVGSTDLTGSGTLGYLRCLAGSISGSSALNVTSALFNETLAALRTNGNLNVTPLPAIAVNPDVITLLAGQTQSFNVTGGATPPITWSTLDPTIATISGSGLLTAVAGGVTQVHAIDAVGATDDNTSVTVYDFLATMGTVTAPPGATVRVPFLTDRDLAPLQVKSLQYTVGYDGLAILAARAKSSGLVGVWGSAGLVTHPRSGQLRVAAAGTAAIGGTGREIQILEFDLSPSVAVGVDLPLTLSSVVFNEGKPSPQVANGVIHVRTTTSVDPLEGAAFALAPCEPDPVRESARFRWVLPAATRSGHATLALYAVDGRRVRVLADGDGTPGPHEAVWDGRDGAGRPVAAGVYLCRLTNGAAALTRKLVVVR